MKRGEAACPPLFDIRDLSIHSTFYEKKAPFCSRPSTENRFRDGLGASD
jgi:hypothetical protein